MCFGGGTTTGSGGGYAANANAMSGGRGIGTGTAAGSMAASGYGAGYGGNWGTGTTPAYNIAAPNYYASSAAKVPINYSSNAASGYARNALNMAPNGYGIGTGTAEGSKAASAGTVALGANSFLRAPDNYYKSSAASSAPGILSNTMSNYNDIMKKFSGPEGKGLQKLLGILSPFITSLIKTPKDTTKTSEDLKAMLNESATAEGAAARAKMLEYINNPEKIGGTATTDYVAALNTDHDAQDAAELSQFKSDWVARGYSTTGSDYNKAMNDLTNKQNIRRNTEVSAARAALYQTQLNAQLNMISQQYGIELGLLEDMMNMDIYSASVKYGIKAQEISDFKDAINALITGNAPGTESASPTK